MWKELQNLTRCPLLHVCENWSSHHVPKILHFLVGAAMSVNSCTPIMISYHSVPSVGRVDPERCPVPLQLGYEVCIYTYTVRLISIWSPCNVASSPTFTKIFIVGAFPLADRQNLKNKNQEITLFDYFNNLFVDYCKTIETILIFGTETFVNNNMCQTVPVGVGQVCTHCCRYFGPLLHTDLL